jgi:hypothetical protein
VAGHDAFGIARTIAARLASAGIRTSVNAVFDIDALDTPDGFVKRLMGVDI